MTERHGHPGTISVAISFSRGSHPEYREAIIDIIRDFEKYNRSYDVSVYIDRDNSPGDNFKIEIDKAFRDADIIICLVTNSFLNNEYILRYERPIIEDFASPFTTNKRVVPVIVSRTHNYITSWLGRYDITTLPTNTANSKPYSHYSNKESANIKIKTKLDEIFKEFHRDVVLKRSKGQSVPSQSYPVRNWIIAFIIIVLLLLLWKLLQSDNKIPRESPTEPPRLRRVPLDTLPKPYRLKEPANEPKSEERRRPEFDTRDPDLRERPKEFNSTPPGIAICNSKSSMQTVFPRDLSEYPYFGKERYGIYESCQGLNKDGYKPCKRNRRWYIVNEQKNQHLRLGLDVETHKDIYAIRPLLNNVAEVYYYDGLSMYLAFCVSLEDGKRTE